MWNSYCGNIFGWGMAGPVIMIVFWLAAILLFIWLVKHFTKSNHQDNSSTKAAAILKERYAKGEISQQEFEEKLKNLQS
ncbi:SHOCT domain-containing protein [Patescibacteria group bacterium]|nr:SHOCT domain-containing protein [Patescibacteria group bacterium]